MRAFVAVFPPPEVRESLFRAARGLPAGGEFHLTRPERIHLTLKFLGDVAQDDLRRVAEALEPVREMHEPFEATISGFGVFPSERRARILWAGVSEGSGPLRALAQDVEDHLQPEGFERDARPYVPHLTLGRTRGRRVNFDTSGASAFPLRFSITGVNLVKSMPGEGGVTYSTLATYPF